VPSSWAAAHEAATIGGMTIAERIARIRIELLRRRLEAFGNHRECHYRRSYASTIPASSKEPPYHSVRHLGKAGFAKSRGPTH
jgi:hypothetical protein